MFEGARARAWPLVRRILIAVAVVAYASICSVFVLEAYLITERDVVIAVTPGGSDAIGEEINEGLIENGVTSSLVVRADDVGVIAEVNGSDSRMGSDGAVNVAFVAQDVDPDMYPDVLSLGTISFQPLLIFARAELGDGLTQADLAGTDISIGIQGSDVNQLATDVLSIYGLTEQVRVHSDPTDVGIEQLLAGEIDALAVLSPPGAPETRELGVNPELTIVSLEGASAAAVELGNAQSATIPPYGISVREGIPKEPITTVAVALTVIAHKYLSEPNVLMVAQQLQGLASRLPPSSDVAVPLPTFDYSRFPASEIARSYYEDGLPLRYAAFPRALITWVWLPLGEIITFTLVVWGVIRFVLPWIGKISGYMNPAAYRLSHMEQRRRDGKPLTNRQIRNLERLIARIEAQRVDRTEQTMQRAQAILDGEGPLDDDAGRSDGPPRGSDATIASG